MSELLKFPMVGLPKAEKQHGRQTDVSCLVCICICKECKKI